MRIRGVIAALALFAACGETATTATDAGPTADGSIGDGGGSQDGAVASDAGPPPPDYVGLGDGHDLSVTFDADVANFNLHFALTTAAPAGSVQIALSTENGSPVAGIDVGDVLLLWQTVVATATLPNASNGPIGAASLGVGQYELAIVAAVNPLGVTLQQPLYHSYSAPGVQVVLVPQYTDVLIENGRDLRSDTYDGLTGLGGIVAILATGTITMDGNSRIDSDGRGSRGPLQADGSDTTGCDGDNELLPDGQAKGAGLFMVANPNIISGRGNLGHGGGGGVCSGSGGGGGGHGAAGGVGGASLDGDRSVGGMGGAQVEYDMRRRLLMGGAGGNGHAPAGESSGRGGNAGAVVFVRANAFAGTGTLSAAGSGGSNSSNLSGGGGGGGGAVYLEVTGTADCALIEINGGDGATVGATASPGGGGGAGRIFISTGGGTCGDVTNVRPGEAGDTGTRGVCRGAGPFCCGDGVIQFPEICDMGDQNGQGQGCDIRCEPE